MHAVWLIPILVAGGAWGGPREKGELLEAEGRFQDAVVSYEEHLAQKPGDREARLRLIHVLISVGETSRGDELIGKEMKAGPPGADLFNEQGRLSFVRGEYQEAEKAFLRALKEAPGFLKARHNLGVTWRRAGRIAQARVAFGEVLEQDPEYVPTLNALAMMSEGGSGVPAALELLAKAEAKAPDDFETLFNLGRLKEAMGLHSESVEYFCKAVGARKHDAEVRNRYARSLVNVGEYKAAALEVEEALNLGPGRVGPVFTLGVLHEEQGRREDARAQYERALEMSPGYAEAAFRLGNISLADSQDARQVEEAGKVRKMVETAVARYEQAVASDKGYHEARYNLALGLLELGRTERAMKEVARLVKDSPDRVQYQMLLGAVATGAGRAEQALGAYRAAVRLDPKCGECRLRLGSLALRTGNLAEAARAYREILKLDESNTDARYSLGLALFRQGELKSAKREVLRVLRVRPDDLDVINTLANISMRMRNLADAGMFVGRAVDTDPAYLPVFRTAELVFAQSPDVQISGSPKTVRIMAGYLRGLRAHRKKPAEAIAAFAEIVKLEPRCTAAHVKLGMLNVLIGKNKEGLAHLEQAKNLVPHDSEIHYAIGTGYYNLAEGKGGEPSTNYYRKAYESYREAARASPQYAEAYWGMGSAMYRLKKYDAARQALEQCLKVNPFFSEAYNTLGSVIAQQAQATGKPEERKKLLEEAVRFYQQSLRANPNSETAHYNLGTMLHELKKYDDSIESYEAALRLNPKFPLARYRLARLYAERGKWPFDRGRAEKEFEQLMLVAPGNCEFTYDFGAFFFNARKYEKAKQKWRQTLDLCPEYRAAQDGLERLIDMGY